MFRSIGRERRSLPALLVFLLGTLGSAAASADDLRMRALPNVQVRSLSGSKDVALAGSLVGRAAVILVTNGGASAVCPVGKAAAELQHEHTTRFSWVAVESGPVEPDDIDEIRLASPVRLDRPSAPPGTCRWRASGARSKA